MTTLRGILDNLSGDLANIVIQNITQNIDVEDERVVLINNALTQIEWLMLTEVDLEAICRTAPFPMMHKKRITKIAKAIVDAQARKMNGGEK